VVVVPPVGEETNRPRRPVSADVPKVINGEGSVFAFPSKARTNARMKPKTIIASNPIMRVFQSQSVTPLLGS
jgi:hypothetical protein